MSATLEFQIDNIYLLRVAGQFNKSDLDATQSDFVENLADAGPIKLLVLLDGFTGFERTAAWDDSSFFFNHGDSLEKIAIVGEQHWQSEMLAFSGAGIRKSPVKFYLQSEEAQARQWLAE